MHVTVWSIKPDAVGQGRQLVRALEEIGYRASLRLLPLSKHFLIVENSSTRAQIGLMPWSADYPSAAAILADGNFDCAGFTPNSPGSFNPSEFCDRTTDRLIAQAQRVQETDQRAADGLWARVEQRIVDQAPIVSLANPKNVDFVSRRAGNYEYNPEWGVLLDQLWVR